MPEFILHFTIEQLGDEAVACTGFDQIANAIEFTRRVDQKFPVGHPQRDRAVQHAKHSGYISRKRAVAEA